jgi:hypothetical protein
MGMDFDNFMAGSFTDRGLTLDHKLAAHEDLCTISIFMAVKEFARNNAAELLDFIDIPVDRLLENLINHFKIP